MRWTGRAFEQQQTGTQAPWLFALSLLFIFLCLVALYESWTLPLAVIAIVPTGLMGAAAAIFLRGMPRCLLQGGRGGDPWGWPPRTRS